MKEIQDRYIYNGNYPYLKGVLERTGKASYLFRSLLKDFGLVYFPIGLRPGNRILDIGSCIGSLGHYLKYGGIKTFGIDLNASAIKIGKQKFGIEKSNVSVVGDAIELPYPSGLFDVVITEEVFEHFPTLEFAQKAFSEMKRVLNPSKNTMLHKITVLEDREHIDADDSHRLKLSLQEWRDFFKKQGWKVKNDPSLEIPILKKKYLGYFLIEKMNQKRIP